MVRNPIRMASRRHGPRVSGEVAPVLLRFGAAEGAEATGGRDEADPVFDVRLFRVSGTVLTG